MDGFRNGEAQYILSYQSNILSYQNKHCDACLTGRTEGAKVAYFNADGAVVRNSGVPCALLAV
eukprot:196204-Prorocentrum_minimum.AAC.3